MEAAIRSHQVGTSQQSAQQPQPDLSGVRGTSSAGPPQHTSHSMSQYSQPRNNASGGINEVHRSSATNSAYQIQHTIPHSYVNVDQRNRVRGATNTFPGASANSGKTNYNWQPPNPQFEYATRTTLHQPTMGTVPTNFVSTNFPQHGGFPPRVSIPQQPQNQPPVPISQSQSVPNSTRPLTVSDYINANIRDGTAPHLQASQPNQRPQPPDPGGQQGLPPQQQQQQQAPSSQPAHKKIRLGESPYQPQTNSLHHPAATPSSIPVRLHHTNYEKAGPPIQSSNSHVVVHVASTPRTHQNPIVGATADIQYQPQKPPSQPPTHQIPTAASPQAPQTQPQQQQTQNQQQQQPPSNTNTKVLSVLKIDTRDPPPPNSSSNSNNNNNNNSNNANSNLGGGYHPKTEAISPAGSPKLSKDDLLQQISSVDSSMMSLEERKKLLKEKERMLIEQKEEGVEDVPEQPTPHRTLAQQIYAENKKKANDSHAILTAFNFKGQTFELPLYNQPSDADVCRKIHEQYLTFRSSLLLHLRKIKSERAQRSQELSDQYAKLSADWQKRVEKIESSMKRKNRELKNRELFEKVFVELRKQREDKERFNRVGSRVKSEADFEVIVDGLQEQLHFQAQEDKKMRSYAVIPPLMFDSRQRRLVFQNENGSQVDMEGELSAYKTLNLWTSGEKEIFRDKYVQQAKNFGFIASNLERKNAQDCVRYYYLSKKDIKYKQLLRKSSKRTRSTKNLPKTSESQSLLDLMTTGVTTRLQRKSRNTSRSSNATSATASAAESQTTNSNSTSTRSSAAASSSAPLPTVTVTVNSSSTQSQENVKEEIDPLCIRSMSETASPSPASNSNKASTRRASSNGNLQSQQPVTVETTSSTTTSTITTTSSTSASFLPANKIKTEPDGDVVMKTESDSNNWSTYPPNGLKHEVIKAEEIKTEGKAVNDDIVKKEETNVKEEKKVEIKKEPNDDKENDEGKGKKTISMEVDDENWNSCEPSSAKKPKIEESGANDLDKALYPCFVCKQENCSRTRPLEKGKAQQYGLIEENIPTGARICSNCQSKAVKSRFPITSCPLPTCPNPKDRVTRLRNLPARLSELSPEERDPIIKELQIPPKVTKCCSVCLTRIKRKMGTQLLGTTSLTDDEIQQFRKQLQDIGPKWNQLAEQLTKSATVLKTFYFHYKKKYGFDQAVNEYYKLHVNEDRRAITDGDESDISVTSSDDNGSDTHKNDFTVTESEKVDNNSTNAIVKSEPQIPSTIPSIPVMPIPASKENTVKNEPPQQQLQQPPTTKVQPQQIIDDRLPPPLGQPPPLLSSQQIQNLSTMPRAPDHPMIHIMRTKKHSEEYDSSATETADEENESSPANRQSPKTSSVFAGKSLNPATTISMVPSAQQNGPSNVRDVMHNVIERSLKNTQVPPLKPNPPGPIDTSPDVSFVTSYRQDPKQMPQSRRSNSEGLQTLATLSIVNSHGPPQSGPQNPQIIAGHPLNISSIAATITPVPPPPQGNQPPRSSSTPQHLNAVQEKDLKYGRPHPQQVNQQPEPEPQTLDLSIKKPQQQQQQPPERNFPAFQAKAPPPPTGGSIYRGDPSANIPNQAPYLAFHPDMNRPSKSPSTYIGPSLSPGQQRVMSLGPHGMQQPQQIVTNKSKVTQKLSPKVHHHQVQQQQGGGQVQQMNGPKGSITLGTPLNDRGQPIMIQNSPQGPRYDILRQTPPNSDNKFGSITAGTPIHLSDKRVHEYIKGNNRHSPATNQPPNVSSAQTSSPHPITNYRQPGELSSTRDLVFSDYMISQQMQGHNQQSRGGPPNMPNTINIISGGPPGPGRPEKESPSPRSLAHSNSPASLYYADKERERAGSGQTRTEYLSRSSPADHHNSTPSPHRTPPPQRREGVIIQRHNAGGSKPPSPAPQRLQVNQGHYTHHYSQGHDALSNLVDVAVAQQALPVPNDGSRRHMPPITSESQSIQRERYPYLIPSDVNVMLQQQQSQKYPFQIEMIRRHELERKEMEKREMIAQERERDRERDERDAQRRHDAELAQRNFERDRMEQLRIPYTSRALSYGRGPDEVISAQHLINAIITENISRPQESRDRYQINPISRLQQAENNGNSHSPNIINVDVDSSSDLSRHQSSISNLPSKNLKLNDITDAIISKDPAFGMHHQQQPGGYHLTSPHFVRTGFSNANTIPSKTPPTQSMAQLQNSGPQLMGQEQIIATDQWKMNRRLQQQQQQKEEMAKSGNPQGRTTPDDRHIIRMAQTPSPRNKMAYEPVSPPETSAHYHMQPKITINAYDQRNMSMPGQDNAPGADANKLLNMLNNRIAEAMRNDDKYPNEHHRNAERKDSRDSDVMKQYDRPRSGNSIPGNGVDSGEKSPAGKRESPQVYISRPSSQPGNQPFQPTMFMYPYSALNIPQVAAGANPIISPKAASELIDANRQQSAPQTQHLESRQVLSEQYDALSDED